MKKKNSGSLRGDGWPLGGHTPGQMLAACTAVGSVCVVGLATGLFAEFFWWGGLAVCCVTAAAVAWLMLVEDGRKRGAQAKSRSRKDRQQRHVQDIVVATKATEEHRVRLATLGPRYASIVESTIDAVKSEISASEAARTGLLGAVDFGADIRGIADNFRKAHELQKVADRLAVLDKPGADDRKVLAEANITIARLESTALKCVELIAMCATEAQLVDQSLQVDRHDAKTAEQRAELHAKLCAMIYGIEATRDTTPADSIAAESVLARVQAYREIKNQI